MRVMKSPSCLAVAMLACACASSARADGFVDVLDAPARMSRLASRSLLHGIAAAGQRLVAVGEHGNVVVSKDAGATWTQSRVPVSSDLTAVYFVDATRGWAVGHDGVVLHTEDAGDSWRLQLDGCKAADLLVAAMARRVAREPASEQANKLLAEARRYREEGADKPFLDVWFADANDGYVVGAYNLIFRTRDGGATWEPWFDRTDNPKRFNLYAIRPAAGALYVAGEGGLVLKLDAGAAHFKALDVPYTGSFFGLVATGDALLVYGLRGTALRTDDGGTTWSKADTRLDSAIVTGTRMADGTLLLADAAGRIVASDDDARTFARVAVKQSMPLTALVATGRGLLAVTGPRGVASVELVR